MPKKRQPGWPRKKKIFDLYVLWKSFPSTLRGKKEKTLKRFGFDVLGILEICNIKTQTEFAAKFKIGDLNTLSDWNKLIEKRGLAKDIWKNIEKKLTSNVNTSFYIKKLMEDPTAADFVAWHKIIEGWRENQQMEHSGEVTLVFKGIKQRKTQETTKVAS